MNARQERLDAHKDTIGQSRNTYIYVEAHENRRRTAQGTNMDPIPPRPASSFSMGPRATAWEGDWGDILTHLFMANKGAAYVVLNMANAYSPGGGPGCAAQEENMHQRSTASVEYGLEEGLEMSVERLLYPPEYRKPLGETAHIRERPRCLFKGAIVYLDDGMIDVAHSFKRIRAVPFYELRSAAVDTRAIHRGYVDFGVSGSVRQRFDWVSYRASMARRIRAQFETCIRAGHQYVLLSAFGCGAFLHKSIEAEASVMVCELYMDAIKDYALHFERIDFAIHRNGYSQDNFVVWRGRAARM